MKIMRIVLVSCLLLVSLVGVFPSSTVLAQEGDQAEEQKEAEEEAKVEDEEEAQVEEEEAPPEPPPELKMTTSHTTLEATSGGSFEFEVKMRYTGNEELIWDLNATGPKGWFIFITPSYPKDKMIRDVRLEGVKGFGDTVLVNVISPSVRPEPGEYTITLEATSGEISGSIELKAVVSAKYDLYLTPATERYNTSVTAGKDNFFSVELNNYGSAAIDDINLSSTKPEGWTIEFTPDEISSLAAGKSQTVDVNIKPPAKTIAGDYNISFQASGNQASTERLQIRVTAETPTIWGWTGVGIILIVVAGLAFVIMRFSRR